MKRSYYPNRKLKVDGVGEFQITTGLTVYYTGDHGEMRRADSLFCKRSGRLVINHKLKVITIAGWDNKKDQFIYEVA